MGTSLPSPATAHFGRAMAFVDAPNFYAGLKRTHSLEPVYFDFQNFILRQINTNVRVLVRAHFYDARVARGNQQAKDMPSATHRLVIQERVASWHYFQLNLPEVNRDQKTTAEAVDLRLAVDMVRYAALGLYDYALLLTNDSDFVPAIRAVKELGKQVHVARLGSEVHDRLKEAADVCSDVTAAHIQAHGEEKNFVASTNLLIESMEKSTD